MGHASYITHLDWSSDSCYLQSADAAHELLYWEIVASDDEPGIRIKPVSSGFVLRDKSWSTWTSVLGWPVQGVWRAGDYDFVQVMCADRSHGGNLLDTGDDLPSLCLFRYPVLPDRETGELPAKHDYNAGHAARVYNARFTFDDSRVISVGSTCGAIFQWKLGPTS